jgi:NaMN:DMB phosphoribosyltransferase
VQPTADQPTSTLTGPDIDIRPGLVLPLPDDAAAAAARDRLSTVDIGVSAPTLAALGMLSDAVVFMAAVQCTPYPRPLLSTRVVLLTGSHSGGVVAGPAPDPRNATPLQHLAINAGAGIVTLEWQPAAAAIELEDAITTDQMDASLRSGWAEAERAADEGIELLVLAAGGAGASVAAAAVVAAITGAEPTMLLTRVVTPAGYYDDNAWMTRCLALRDALHRVRDRDGDPRTVLSALGGADIAAATGLILGAAARRTPIMIDGPVGAAAALLANDFSPQSRSWIVLPDTGRHPAVRLATDSLQLRPWLDLCLDLGEGAASLSALPLLQTALTLAGAGEQVEPQPLTRVDSTGNQVYVGVAKPVDAGEDEAVEDAEAFTGTTMETAPVTYSSAHANGEPAAATPAGADDAEPAPPAKATSAVPAARAAEPKPAPDRKAEPAAPKPDAKTRPDLAAAKPAKTAEPAPKPAEAAKPGGPAAKPADAGGKPAEPTTAKPAGPKPAEASPQPGETSPKPGVKAPTRTATKPPPAKAGANRALTAKTAASKAVPTKATAAPKDDDARHDDGAQNGAPKDQPTSDAQTKDAPAKDAPAKDGPVKAAATEAALTDTVVKDAPDQADGRTESRADAQADDDAGEADGEPTAVVAAGSAATAPRPRKRP